MPTYDETLEAIYAPEETVESVVQALLKTVFTNVYKQRDDDEIAYPCVSVQFVLGGSTQKQHTTPDGPRDAAWNGQLIFGVHTTRNGAASNETQHRPMRAKIRKLMAKFESNISMTYHALRSVTDAGSVPSYQNDDDTDSSVITFNVSIEVKKATWPTAPLIP